MKINSRAKIQIVVYLHNRISSVQLLSHVRLFATP